MLATTLGCTKVNIKRQPLLFKIKRIVVERVFEAACFDQMFALLQIPEGNVLSRIKEACGSDLAMSSISTSEGSVSVIQ